MGRLKQLSFLSNFNISQIINVLDTIKLKHCLDLIAIENNFLSWQDLVQNHMHTNEMTEEDIKENDLEEYELYRYNLSEAALNSWYPTYAEAKIHLDRSGGYLLPYKNHFFICQAQHIVGLGINPNDPDWEKIGKNWIEPKDKAAKLRLIEKLKEAQNKKFFLTITNALMACSVRLLPISRRSSSKKRVNPVQRLMQ